MQNLPIFSIIFKDGTHFIGGTDYFKTKWLEIPFKKIKRIFYKLPNGDYILLDDKDRFFHMVEATTDLNGKLKGQTILRYAYIMYQKENKVTSYRITLFNQENDKFRANDITVREFDINDERIKKLNSDNWR